MKMNSKDIINIIFESEVSIFNESLHFYTSNSLVRNEGLIIPTSQYRRRQ